MKHKRLRIQNETETDMFLNSWLEKSKTHSNWQVQINQRRQN